MGERGKGKVEKGRRERLGGREWGLGRYGRGAWSGDDEEKERFF